MNRTSKFIFFLCFTTYFSCCAIYTAHAGGASASKRDVVTASDTDREDSDIEALTAPMAALARGALGSSVVSKDGEGLGLVLDDLSFLPVFSVPLTVTQAGKADKLVVATSAISTVHALPARTASGALASAASAVPMARSAPAASPDKPAAGAGAPLPDIDEADVYEGSSEEEKDEGEDSRRVLESPASRRLTHAHAATEPLIRRREFLAPPDARARLARSHGALDDVRATLAPKSVLYNGPQFSIVHGPEGTPSYTPFPRHLALTSYEREDKNTARFYVSFFGTDGSIEYWNEPKVFIHGSTGPKSATHGGNLFPDSGETPDYKNFLGWLLQIYPDDAKLTRAYADPVKFFNDQSINRPYHHTEQWILWVIRRDLEARLQEIRRTRPDFRLTSFEVNIYTHNNPCADCGPTVEKALPFFEQQIAEISTRLGFGFGSVRGFSNISSTKPYGRTHLPMPSLTSEHIDIPPHLTDGKPSYQEVYAGSPLVTAGPLAITAAHGTVHHFWIPRLWGVTFETEKGVLRATLKSPWRVPRKKSPLKNLDFFLQGFAAHPHVAEEVRVLDFGGHALEFSTSGESGKLNPFNFYLARSEEENYTSGALFCLPFYLKVVGLNLYGTNARSAFMPKMLSAFSQLTSLDLRGALAYYRDYEASADQPRKELWTTLRGMPHLETLDLGSYTNGVSARTSNNITFQEFALLLGVPVETAAGARNPSTAAASVPFPKIRALRLEGNKIFTEPLNAVANHAGNILTRFVKAHGATPPAEVDLSNNGLYMHVSAAQAERALARATPPTDIIF